MVVEINFLLPPAEAEGLARVHRNPSEAAKRIVRAALYRQRSREARIRFKREQRQKREAENVGAR